MRIIINLAAAIAIAVPAAAQEQNSTITLSCNGTIKVATAAADPNTYPIKDLGIIVNVADHTVAFMSYVVPITSITATLVSFSGKQTPPPVLVSVPAGFEPKPFTVDGAIDRVTGYASIGFWYENVGDNYSWELSCRPTKRLF